MVGVTAPLDPMARQRGIQFLAKLYAPWCLGFACLLFWGVSRKLFQPTWAPPGLSGGVFSGVMEIHFYAFFNGFWPKTGIWPILKPHGPLSSHLEEISKNINFP